MSSDVFTNEDSFSKVSDCTSAQMQELNDVKEFFKIQRMKYIKYKILYSAIEECVSNSNYMDIDLRSKIKDILFGNSCAQVLDLESDGFSQHSQVLLGLTDLNVQRKLNYNESSKVRKSMEVILQNKYKSICEHLAKLAGKDINVNAVTTEDFRDFSLSREDQELLELKGKLQEQQQKYLNSLLKEQEILEDITKLRLEKVPEVCNDKVKESQIKSRVSELRSKIVHEKTRIDIFLETHNSLPAYEELMKDVREQYEECQRDIQHLKMCKKQYQQIACKQYDEILKSYIQYKSSLAKKKIIYESFHN